MQLEPGIPPGESPCVWRHTFTDWPNRTHTVSDTESKLSQGISLSLNIIKPGQKQDENQWTSKLLEIRWHSGRCLASHSSGHTILTRPEKTESVWHTSAVGNYNWNTRLTKADPDGTKTGYEQVYTLLFGKHNRLGVSLPPAESLPCGWMNSDVLHSLHRLITSLAGKNHSWNNYLIPHGI